MSQKGKAVSLSCLTTISSRPLKLFARVGVSQSRAAKLCGFASINIWLVRFVATNRYVCFLLVNSSRQ